MTSQNALLLAAGFAAAFQERSLAELENARQAIEQILEAHKPYPAFALDRHWNVVASNSALPQLYEGCSPELLRKPINALRLVRATRVFIPPRARGTDTLVRLEPRISAEIPSSDVQNWVRTPRADRKRHAMCPTRQRSTSPGLARPRTISSSQ